MKKFILSSIGVLLCLTISFAQDTRPEAELMNCMYNSYKDGGVAFKNILNDFEQQLVVNNFLNDASGESYIALLNKMSNKEINNLKLSSFSFNAIKEIETLSVLEAQICSQELKKELDLDKFKGTKLDSVMNEVMSADNISITQYSSSLLSFLTAEDFELDLYKINLLYFFGIVNNDIKSGIERKGSIDYKETETFNLEKSIKVFINSENKIFIDNNEVSVEVLNTKIRDYMVQNKSESYIVIENDLEVFYEKYIQVHNSIISTINTLRKELSIKKFDKEYKDLNIEEVEIVKAVYPINIRESNSE
ncbi:biopolymer transporter ExbD [uncultured Lacinutrix sp.]|uniref:biopolymer transporter ExbD n=1 Tax=uncultured Lacinutrix sp. TaxID=574032 RepID=UPI0026399414|nr:biopolymer transporter ExbD [uncultured Lacinutrix sp.]